MENEVISTQNNSVSTILEKVKFVSVYENKTTEITTSKKGILL